MTAFYFAKNGEDVPESAITTDAPTLAKFIEEFYRMITPIFQSDNPHVVARLLVQFVEICCKYKGYKSDSVEESVSYTVAPAIVLLDRENYGPDIMFHGTKLAVKTPNAIGCPEQKEKGSFDV